MRETIPETFADQVRRGPDRLAVESTGHALTYAELNRRANRIATALLHHGGRAGEPVALLMDHGAPLVAAMLGVLKAGRISLCLDRAQPVARLGRMLDDAQPAVIVTDDAAADAPRVGVWRGRMIDAHTIPDDLADDEVDEGPAPRGDALLFYTSGSSGRPKGVVLDHRSLVHGAMMQAKELQISSSDRLSLMHACSVAASRSMLFGGLLNGATVCAFDVRRDGVHALADWMRLQQITVCHMVPSLFRAFASRLSGPESLPALRAIKLGGEAVTRADVDLYQRRFSRDCVLVNSLGATEIGCGNACYFRIDHDTVLPGAVVPVGYAADGVDVRVQDDRGHDVPPGDVGEIVIRTEFLASSYWHDPETTRRALAPIDPGDTTPAFRTGDLGRFDADGCLTHLGRKDQLIKIRGHRVELMEVEGSLRQADGVADAAVVVRPGEDGAPQMVAFFVAGPAGEASPSSVRESVARQLPPFMMPSVFVAVAALPMLPGGKVDRSALALLARETGRGSTATPVADGDVLQLQLQGIWAQALHLSNIGISDNFFELGGHSLAAADVCARIERVLGIRLPLVVMVEAPTIAQLADVIRGGGWAASWSPLVPLQPNGTHPPLYCVPGAGSDVFALQDLARHLAPDQPMYGLQPRGLDGTEPFHRTVETLAAYYVEAIRRHQPSGPYYLAGTSFGGKVAFEMAHQLQAAGADIGALAVLDSQGPGYPMVSSSLRVRERWVVTLRRIMPGYLFNLMAESWLAGELTGPRLAGYLRTLARYSRAKLYVTVGGWAARPFDLRFECLQAVSFSASERYVARPLQGRIHLFRTEHQPAAALFEADPELGWRGLATGGVRVRVVPGQHGQHIRAPNVGVLAEELRICLEQARATATADRITTTAGRRAEVRA